MNLGEELKVDRPPKKYERNWGILVDLLPVILACVMVCLLTWSKMKDSTMEQKDIILMLSATCAATLMIAAAAFYASRRAARKSFVEVFPVLPVTATTGTCDFIRSQCASCCTNKTPSSATI